MFDEDLKYWDINSIIGILSRLLRSLVNYWDLKSIIEIFNLTRVIPGYHVTYFNCERSCDLCCRWQPEIRKNAGNQWYQGAEVELDINTFPDLFVTGFWSRSTDFPHFSIFPTVICSINQGPAHNWSTLSQSTQDYFLNLFSILLGYIV